MISASSVRLVRHALMVLGQSANQPSIPWDMDKVIVKLLSISLSLSLSLLSLSLSLSISLSISLFIGLSFLLFYLSISLACSLFLALSLSLYLACLLSFPRSLSLSLSLSVMYNYAFPTITLINFKQRETETSSFQIYITEDIHDLIQNYIYKHRRHKSQDKINTSTCTKTHCLSIKTKYYISLKQTRGYLGVVYTCLRISLSQICPNIIF